MEDFNERQVNEPYLRTETESELRRLQERAVETLSEGILITNAKSPDNPIIYCNAGFEKLTGYISEEVKGRNCRFLQGVETDRETVAAMRQAISEGEPYSDEIYNYRKDGTGFWNYLSIYPIRDSLGQVSHFVGIQQDVTAWKLAENALRESEERIRTVVNSVPLIFFAADNEGIITLSEGKGLQKLNLKPGQRVGQSVFDIYGDVEVIENNEKTSTVREVLKRVLSGEIVTGVTRLEGIFHDNLFIPRWNESEQVTGFICVSTDITERRRAEELFRASEERYQRIAANIPGVVYQFVMRSDGSIEFSFISEGTRELYGFEPEAIRRNPYLVIDIIDPEDRPSFDFSIAESARLLASWKWEGRITLASGKQKWVQGASRPELQANGDIFWDGLLMDITDRKLLEEHLRQSQKLEAVGKLAGGIAHDFNNMLTAINGYSEMLLRKLEKDSALRSTVEEIKKAGERSALLTHQLLAFSRRQVLQPKIIELDEIINDMSKFLSRLIGEDIHLSVVPNSEPSLVEADPGQINQVIMNLVVNSRDAMPKGGKLTIETRNVYLDAGYAARHVPAKPGKYVMLAVSDTGVGMNEQTRRQVFEPFFTTKEVGKGTGLGLATVYGIVKQSGGYIWVYSEEGKGTTFKIYLPSVSEEAETVKNQEMQEELYYGTETILLVEDEEIVRNLSRQILEECGYRVIEAQNGADAIKIIAEPDFKIDLLITDVVMPEMGGRELTEQLTEMYPELPVLYMSGYTDDVVIRHEILESDAAFIQKPFTFESLTGKIRDILNKSKKS